MTVTSLPDKLFLANNSLGIRIFTNTLNLSNKIKQTGSITMAPSLTRQEKGLRKFEQAVK
jgi:hypothetical protein